MTILIRHFTETDRTLLRRVYLQARQEHFNWLNPMTLSLIDFDADTVDETIWVGEHGGQIVGFISVWLPENFIHHLFVLPHFKRQGYGTALLASGLQTLGRPAWLKCVAENQTALDFYQINGWVQESRGDEEGSEFYLMEYAIQ
ncbi:GNAT family N-acetyltransferase [Reinekea sp.]|uniref:GNAT family N-acetyltransferase n=1 Tax=Reinekea sp. TaxID=1970455 RepID=UPI002A810D09|nr:GNAT family N-acetyltransferase [Reinekea sp.]